VTSLNTDPGPGQPVVEDDPPPPADQPPEPAVDASQVALRVVPFVAVGLALLWAYAPEFRLLWETWSRDPNYSHGFLVIPVALWILWRRRSLPTTWSTAPWPWGWALLVLVLVLRAFFYERGSRWTETVTLLPALGCLALTYGGWGLFRKAWPAIAFLIFMVPLGPSLNNLLSQPLQSLATAASTWVLKLTGLWVISEGNVIYVGKDPLEVAEACNGLSMLMSLAAVTVAMTLLINMARWMRVVALLSIVPVALLSNMLRIVGTAWAVHSLGAGTGWRLAHDAAGWMMMPLALVLVGLELAVLAWLFVEQEVVVQPLLLGRPIVNDRHRNGVGREVNAPGLPRAQGDSEQGREPR
jgi:exosortase